MLKKQEAKGRIEGAETDLVSEAVVAGAESGGV
jgi:hypothetical protein